MPDVQLRSFGGQAIRSIGIGTGNLRGRIALSANLSGNSLTIALDSASRLQAAPAPELTAFTIAGGDALGSVTAAASPELASTTSGTTTGDGQVVSALGAALDVGAVYLVSYEITAVTGAPGLFFPATNGSPFGTAQNPLAATVGIHSYVVAAEDADTAAIMRQSGAGSITFGFISCRKAEWTADVTLADPEENIAFAVSLGADGPQRSGSTSKPPAISGLRATAISTTGSAVTFRITGTLSKTVVFRATDGTTATLRII